MGGRLSEKGRGEHESPDWPSWNGATSEVGHHAKSGGDGLLQEDRAKGNMALDWAQVETALNNSASHFEDTNKSILQFCEGTGIRSTR